MNAAKKYRLAAERATLLHEAWRNCSLCPRECRVNRPEGQTGYCGAGSDPVICTAFLHHGEEPGISGRGGSGTIFFSGCNLKCVYCQNHRFSHSIEENQALVEAAGGGPEQRPRRGRGAVKEAGRSGDAHTFEGERVTSRELANIMLSLQAKGAENINLVTPTHFLPPVMEALSIALREGLKLPLVYNTSGYEKAETIEILDGIVDIYLADLRYVTPPAAERYSNAPDYPEVNRGALRSMYRQKVTRWEGESLKEGLVVRHLVLPGYAEESTRALAWVQENIPGAVISLMSQYRPYFKASLYPEINRRVNAVEYRQVRDCLENLRLEGWTQELSSEERLAGVHFKSTLEGLI
jgi:putative pyruvate formate lyase activating enzyme